MYEIREYRAINSDLIVYKVLASNILTRKEAVSGLNVANWYADITMNKKNFITIDHCPETIIKDYVIGLKEKGLKLITIKRK